MDRNILKIIAFAFISIALIFGIFLVFRRDHEGTLGNSAFTGPNFFQISSQSLTIINRARDFFIGEESASSSADFAVDPGNNIIFASANFDFYAEIRPDGATCSNGQILKKTAANDWDCASDSTGSVASNSLDFDEFVNSMTVDADTTITAGAKALTFDHASVSGNFEVNGIASASQIIFRGGTASLPGISVSGDRDTGIAVSGANDLRLTAGGSVVSWNGDAWYPPTDATNGLGYSGNRWRDLFTVRGSASSDFEIGGYASASKYFGSAFFGLGGTTGCAGASDTLNYNSTTGVFSCGSDASGTVASNSIDWDEIVNAMTLDAATTITNNGLPLTFQNSSISVGFEVITGAYASFSQAYIANGTSALPALSFGFDTDTGIYRVGANSLGFSAGGAGRLVVTSTQVQAVTAGTAAAPGITWNGDTNTGFLNAAPDTIAITNGGTIGFSISPTFASVSVPFEVESTASISGALTLGYASHTFAGTLEGQADNTFSIGTYAKKIKQFFSYIVRVTTTLIIPFATGGPTLNESGAIGVDTASRSLNFYDGTSEAVIDPRKCIAQSLAGSDLTAKNQWTIFVAEDPYTIDSVFATASGSNSLSWNLKSGSGTVPTTNVFSADKQASGSSITKYTSFTAANVLDLNKLDIVVSSTSAVLDSVYVRVCMRKSS